MYKNPILRHKKFERGGGGGAAAAPALDPRLFIYHSIRFDLSGQGQAGVFFLCRPMYFVAPPVKKLCQFFFLRQQNALIKNCYF